jgi:hypothetical protein
MSIEKTSSWDQIQPTSDLAALALDRLKNGETGVEFSEIAGHLQCCSKEPHAMVEGTLLLVGAEMHVTYEGLMKAIANSDATLQTPTNMTSLIAQLDYVEMGVRSRGLRPIGYAILDHCLVLTVNEEVTEKLEYIKDIADDV